MSPSPLYQTVATDLRSAYDGSAKARSSSERASWQLQEREAFLARLQREGRKSLFEVGAGAGHDSLYFAHNGLTVVATDLSPQMVAMCRGRGLEAHIMDVVHLQLPIGAFDAAYAMNSLLHVPNSDLADALLATVLFVPYRQLLAQVERVFSVEEFHVVQDDGYFQALTLRARRPVADAGR